MKFIAHTQIISGKQLNEFLRLVPKHTCGDGEGAFLGGPRNGTEEYIQIGETQSVLSVTYDYWYLYDGHGNTPIRIRFCPWCGEELPTAIAKARKLSTEEIQIAFPHLSVNGTKRGVTA